MFLACRRIPLLVSLLALTLAPALLIAAGAPASKPADKPATPATKPAGPATPTGPAATGATGKVALQQAVTALLDEYKKANIKPNIIMPAPEKKHEQPRQEGIRIHSDYFTKVKPEGVTPEMVLQALERRLAPDAAADSYVKWQLLSAVPDKFPKELLARVYRLYRTAPVPARHPGLARNDLDRALNRVGINNRDAESSVNDEYGNVVVRYRLAIEPVLAYRDELYAKLPSNFDTFMAGLADLYDRASVGAPANGFWTTVSTAMRSWALTGNNPAQMRQLASAIMRLQDVVANDRNKPYARISWQKTDKYEGLKWIAEGSIQGEKSMEETANWLAEQAANPGGGIGFKEEIKEKK